jgi:hypothetical protein
MSSQNSILEVGALLIGGIVRLFLILAGLLSSPSAFADLSPIGGGGSSYDQSLNSTDSVTFSSLTSSGAASVDGMYLGKRVSGTYLGTSAGSSQQAGGIENTGLGYLALQDLNTGDWNTAIGYRAGSNITTGAANVAIGNDALMTLTTATNNVAIGHRALELSNNENNVCIGGTACVNVTTGQRNTCVGAACLGQVQGGGSNVAMGTFAASNATGNFNTAIGSEAIGATSSGSSNTALGYLAGYSAGSSSGSVYLGAEAGYSNTTSNKLFIDNSNTASPLIGGDFSANTVTINGRLDATGGLMLSTSTAKPTCAVGVRGLMWNTQGGAGVADVLEICQKNAGDSYVWVTK